MISIVFLTVMSLIMNDDKVIFNFDSPETSGDWTTVNDVVMGGVSESQFEINSDSTATFSGEVLPDNNGGFASARASIKNELREFDGVLVRVKGDGNIYNLRFRTDNNFDGMSYHAKFKTEAGDWKEYKLPFSDFKPTFRGMTLSNKPALESKNIRQIGILIADKQFGKFELSIDWLKLY